MNTDTIEHQFQSMTLPQLQREIDRHEDYLVKLQRAVDQARQRVDDQVALLKIVKAVLDTRLITSADIVPFAAFQFNSGRIILIPTPSGEFTLYGCVLSCDKFWNDTVGGRGGSSREFSVEQVVEHLNRLSTVTKLGAMELVSGSDC